MMRKKLDKILKPKSVAVIGASDRIGSVGQSVLHNMLTADFQGNVYPVNLRHSEVQGRRAYRHVGQIEEQVDLAIVCTPATSVPKVVRECGEAGVGGITILTAGFKEAGEEGKRMFEEIRRLAREYRMRVIGPNCLGFMNPHLGINASFATRMALPGNIAFISQSGALLTSILDWSVEQNVGFSYFVSIGSMLDVSFADLIDYFGSDPQTSCILIYMESMGEARRFMSAARSFARNKPIILLKAGRSQEGGQAALSHTGGLAGNNDVFEAAFRRAGVIQVETIAQLFHCAQSLAMQPRPKNNRLAMISNAGGPAVLATDFLIEHGGRLAQLSQMTLEKLQEQFGDSWSHANPVDLLGEAGAEDYRQALGHCLKDREVDGVLVLLTPQAMTKPTEIATAVVKTAKHSNKPVLAVWMGESEVWEGREILEAGKIPHYRYPESAVDVFLRMYQYHRNLQFLYETPPEAPGNFRPQRQAVRSIIERALSQNRRSLTESESKRLMQCYEIPVTQNKIVNSEEEAEAFAESIGYPVVMKIASHEIGHKTELGGVRLNIPDAPTVRETFRDIMERVRQHKPDAEVEGILVEQMVDKPFELLIGARKDEFFGPVIVFGRGGVGVEVYRDYQLGLPPLNMSLARHIIEGTRIFPLLQGYRGLPGVDLENLEFTLCKFAYLVMDFPQISEIDINPFVADETGGIVLDAHITLEATPGTTKPYKHLSICPYPERYEREVQLQDDTPILLRPIRPEDEPLVNRMLKNVSNDTLYLRFFGHIPKIIHEWLTRFTHIDYDREIAIIALAQPEEDGSQEMIGVVRIIEDAWGESAEYAILVSDGWHKKGLGTLLTDYILDIAHRRGLQKIVASVLPANTGMIRIFEKRGFTFDRSDLEIWEVELDLASYGKRLESVE